MKATIRGSALMMHNGRLADPLDPMAKALSDLAKRRKKSDADHIAVAEAEFKGGLYWDGELGPYIPGEAIMTMLIDGAKQSKQGKLFKSSVMVVDEKSRLEYRGPRTPDELWADPRFRDRRSVRVGQAKVMRTRPIFRDWSLSFEVQITNEAINKSDVQLALKNAGSMVGLGDGRPRIAGKFEVISFK